MNVLDEIGRSQMKPKDQVPQFNVGDTVRVHFRIVEGEKERVQIFEGVVMTQYQIIREWVSIRVGQTIRVAEGTGQVRH